MTRALLALGLIALSIPSARAIVGDAPLADETIARYAVMVQTPHGRCTGVVLAQDLVLTAAHCVYATHFVGIFGPVAGRLFRLAEVMQTVLHPLYDPAKDKGRVADLALLKLGKPLRNTFVPAFLSPRPAPPRARVVLVGYGMSSAGNRTTSGTARMTMLRVLNQLNNLLMLSDDTPSAAGVRLGGCGGDSGAPAFAIAGGVPTLVGIVSAGEQTCSGATFATPLWPYRDWLVETASKLGSPLSP